MIDGFSHASGHPRPTMTHRVASVWYIRDTMLHDAFHFSYLFFRHFHSFLSISLSCCFYSSSSFFSQVSLTCAAVETSTASCRCQRCARSNPATACARTVVNPVAR